MSSLTPLDILGKEFTRDRGGYATNEVEAFLEELAEQFRQLRDENAHLRDQLTGRNPRMPLPTRRSSPPSMEKRRKFTKAASGYAIGEVETFLDQLTAEFGYLRGENAALRDQLAGVGADMPPPSPGAPVGGRSPDEVRSMLSSYRTGLERGRMVSSEEGGSPRSEGRSPTSGVLSPTPWSEITPYDVQQKEFTKAARGYAMAEVDAFLDDVTVEFTRMQDEIAYLRTQLGDVHARTPQQTVTEPEQIVTEPEQIVTEPEQTVTEPEQTAHSTPQFSSRGWRPTSQGQGRIRQPTGSSPDPAAVDAMRRYITELPPSDAPNPALMAYLQARSEPMSEQEAAERCRELRTELEELLLGQMGS
jgi:DivIVA domain-containing protein